MPHPVAVVADTRRQYCPYEAREVSALLRKMARAPLIARPGKGFIYAQTVESKAEAVARALEELTGSKPRVVRPPEPESPLEAVHVAVALVDVGHYWLAHEVLEHAWGEGADWLHAPTVATAALVKAQEGDLAAARWILDSLAARVWDPYRLVDWKCLEAAVASVAACNMPCWAGDCIGPRVYEGPPPI